MRWEIALALGAMLVFFGLRFTARGWIINRWIEGKLSDVQTGALLGLMRQKRTADSRTTR
jgi:anthranilate phosphoribosyltransferase